MLYAMNKKPEVVEQLQELYDSDFLGEDGMEVETMALAGNDTAEVEPVVPEKIALEPERPEADEDESDAEEDPLDQKQKE